MTIATANRSELYAIPETSWGVARPALAAASTFAVTVSGDTPPVYKLTDSGNGLLPASLPVGATFVATGFTESENAAVRGVVTARASNGGEITFTPIGTPLPTAEAAGDSVVITPVPRAVRMTDGGVNLIVNTIRSSELRADRMISDLIRAGFGGEGTINGELSAQNWDEFISSAMYNDWSPASAALDEGATFAITTGPDNAPPFKLTDSGGGLDDANFPIGGMFRATGFTQGVVIGVVTARTSDSDITFSPLNTVIAEAAGDMVTITPVSTIINGVTENSLTLFQNFADAGDAGIWRTTPGFIASPFGITVEADNIATVACGGQARDATYGEDEPPGGTVDSFTDPVMSAADVLDVVIDGNPAAQIHFQSIELTIENNLRNRKALSTIENLAVVAGEADIGGTAAAYFENQVLFDKYRAGLPYTIGMSIEDAEGHGYAFYLPRVKSAEAEQTPGGSNEDIFDEITFTATRHAGFNAYMLVGRF